MRHRADSLAYALIERGARADLRIAAALHLDSLDSYFAGDGTLLPHAHSGHRPHYPRLDRKPATDHETLADAMAFATRRGHVDVVDYLLDRGADVHGLSPRFFWKGDEGVTPLHHAVDTGNLELVALLLERGADPARPDMWGDTPVDWAGWSDDKEEIAKLLAEVVADSAADD